MQQLLIPGRVRDYGESPRKRARLAVEGFTWGCPSMPSAAELADTDRILVAAESVMSQQAADLAPGTAVEYRSREAYLIGGWFRATIRQVLTSIKHLHHQGIWDMSHPNARMCSTACKLASPMV